MNVQIRTVIEIKLWQWKHGKFLICGWDANACIERRQVPAASKSTSHNELLRLADVERVRPGISDSKSLVVELVIVDIVVGEAGDSHVETVGVSIGTFKNM